MNTIGIRREDKSSWEAGVPIVPDDLRKLVTTDTLRFLVESSPIRIFPDRDYVAAGAQLVNETPGTEVLIGVKEIPAQIFKEGRLYVCFSHTIKGQSENMPSLKRMIGVGGSLLDYECIVDDLGRRKVFFGRFAGAAGMADSLWALGQRLECEGISSPFADINPAHAYQDVDHLKKAVRLTGEHIRREGLPDQIVPFVCGFAGYGNVSSGAQEVFDVLPVTEVGPDQLGSLPSDPKTCYKVVFKEEDLVRSRQPGKRFELQDYYDHPENYEAAFADRAATLSMLINCIYWDPRYPRLLTRDDLHAINRDTTTNRLRVIGDITRDIDGSLACTVKSTTPDDPVYVYDPETGTATNGVAGNGPVVLAVDFLPCELPRDSSAEFSTALRGYMPSLARADLSAPLEQSGLPAELQRAMVVYQGKLTPQFKHLARFL